MLDGAAQLHRGHLGAGRTLPALLPAEQRHAFKRVTTCPRQGQTGRGRVSLERLFPLGQWGRLRSKLPPLTCASNLWSCRRWGMTPTTGPGKRTTSGPMKLRPNSKRTLSWTVCRKPRCTRGWDSLPKEKSG
eukprot:scaffold4038_cov403-Prasinococcus_capsulatus_cf.AAC.1